MRVLCVYHALPRSVLTGCPDSLHSPPPLQLASVMLEPFQNFYHEPPPACTVTIPCSTGPKASIRSRGPGPATRVTCQGNQA